MLPGLALAETEEATATKKETLKICPAFYDPYEYTVPKDESEEVKKARVEEFSGAIDDKELTINKKTELKKETCGLPNKSTGFLEKGDCSAAGYVITELSEPIGNPIAITEGEDAGNKIINVYKGTCCWYADWNEEGQQECYETREIYAETIGECDAAASFCSQRQWVIGNSGAGIIKLYVKQIYTFMAFTVGSIAVATMVVSGIQISVSGVSGDISAAKQRMTQAIVGIVLLFFSGILLYTINPTFFT